MTAATKNEPSVSEHLNEVHLRGRLSAAAERRELPSGDDLCVFRIVVERPAGARGRLDCVDCASTGARVRQTVERASPGELIEVRGQLRRRFWRSPGGPTSRYEVEVSSASRPKVRATVASEPRVRAGRRSDA